MSRASENLGSGKVLSITAIVVALLSATLVGFGLGAQVNSIESEVRSLKTELKELLSQIDGIESQLKEVQPLEEEEHNHYEEAEGTEPTKTIEIIMKEWGFLVDGKAGEVRPDGTIIGGPVITLKRGEVVKLLIRNEGKVLHDFSISAKDPAQHLHLAEIEPIKPGEVREVIFEADEAGEFTYHCMIPGHEELGMVGTILVIE